MDTMTRNRETAPSLGAKPTTGSASSTGVPMHFRSIVRAQNAPVQMPERFRDLIRREEQAAFLDKMTVLDWTTRTVTKTGVQRIEAAPVVDAETAVRSTRWSWALDSLLSVTVPQGHFTLGRVIKNALTKGGLVLAAVASFTIPADMAGAGLGTHTWSEDPGISQDGGRVTQMMERFDCSYSGMPEGVKAKHAIVQDKADKGGEDKTAEVVPFNRGWDIYNDPDSAQYLVAVCAR